jgi:hypothetical protein
MVITLPLTTMLGSGMRSFAGSVRLRSNRRMRGSRPGLSMKPGSGMRLSSGMMVIVIVTATGATVMIGGIGIVGSGLT